MATHEPTTEQLERAWRELAKPEWGSLAEAMAAARRYAIARARATALANGRGAPPAEPPAVATAPASWGSLKVTHTAPLHDRKSAAAGERDDD